MCKTKFLPSRLKNETIEILRKKIHHVENQTCQTNFDSRMLKKRQIERHEKKIRNAS